MKKLCIIGTLGLLALTGLARGDSQILYVIDFGSPPHTVGLPPVVGSGPPPRDTISDIRFGSPIVVADLDPLVDQPLRFEYGDQIALDLHDLPPSEIYTLYCELMVSSVQGRFSVFFDAPSIRRISFLPDGTIDLVPMGDIIGSYEFDQIIYLVVEVDLSADEWTIYLDDVEVHHGTFNPATQISTVRFSSLYGGLVGLDNVVITALGAVADEDMSWSKVKILYR